MSFDTFMADVLATIIGGLFLALLFFWSREKIFPLPSVTGHWVFEITTVRSSYNPYKNMMLRYVAIIWREGNRIKGTVEKIYENSSTGERSYDGENRTRGQIDGYIEKNFFERDRVFLHIVEDGHGRQSTNFFELVVENKSKLSGKFTSMVANQEGTVEWRRNGE